MRLFKSKGFDVTRKDVLNYIDAAEEYIEIARDQTGEDYSVQDWYKETKANYPEDLRALKKDLDESKLAEKILDKDVYTIGIYGDEIPGFNSVRQFIEYLERKGLKIHDFDGDMDYGWDITVSGPARILYNEINNKIPGYHSDSIDDFFDEYSLDEIDESVKESKLTEARKPRYWNSTFATKVIDAYNNKELTQKNIDEWETKYNGGKKPNPSLGTKEILNYYIKTKKDPRLDESKLTEAPMDVKDYAARLRSRKAEKGQNPLDKINSQLNPDMPVTDQLQVYFDELVPPSGPAKTIAGELVRAIMRILYRDYNDGDLWYTGYGKETCGDSVIYLLEHIEDLQDLFDEMIYREMENEEYTEALEEVASRVMVYLNEHPELFTTPLDKDSRSGADLESYFDLPKYEFEPDTSYDDSYYDVSDDDIDEFIHDIVESDFRGAHVNRWAQDGWTIEDLDKEELEQLEDVWDRWFRDFLSQHEREEEPEDEDDEYYDEDDE